MAGQLETASEVHDEHHQGDDRDDGADDRQPRHCVAHRVDRDRPTLPPAVAPDELHEAVHDHEAPEQRREQREERHREVVDSQRSPSGGVGLGPVGHHDDDEDADEGDQDKEDPEYREKHCRQDRQAARAGGGEHRDSLGAWGPGVNDLTFVGCGQPLDRRLMAG